jgi:hypothetical protein
MDGHLFIFHRSANGQLSCSDFTSENRPKAAEPTGNIAIRPQYIVYATKINTLPCYFSLYKPAPL